MAIPRKLLDAFAILGAQPERAMARADLAERLARSEKQLRRLRRAYTRYREQAPPTLPLALPELREPVRFGRKWWQLDDIWLPCPNQPLDPADAPTVNARIALPPRLAEPLATSRAHPPDRSLVHVELPADERGVRWVLGWGRDAEVLEPASFRGRIASELAWLSARYADLDDG